MLAFTEVDTNVLITTIGAIIVAVPAAIAAVSSIRTSRKIKTNHGLDIGAHVERIGDDVYDLTRAFERHADDDERRFQQVLDSQKGTRANIDKRSREIIAEAAAAAAAVKADLDAFIISPERRQTIAEIADARIERRGNLDG